MNIKFWNHSQGIPDSCSEMRVSLSSGGAYASNAHKKSSIMDPSAGAQQPSIALCHWDLISLQDNARMLRQIADDIDAILKKAAPIEQS